VVVVVGVLVPGLGCQGVQANDQEAGKRQDSRAPGRGGA